MREAWGGRRGPDAPVLLIQFVLPLELPALYHAVVPEHLAARQVLVQLFGEVAQEGGCIPHRSRLGREGAWVSPAACGTTRIQRAWEQEPTEPSRHAQLSSHGEQAVVVKDLLSGMRRRRGGQRDTGPVQGGEREEGW